MAAKEAFGGSRAARTGGSAKQELPHAGGETSWGGLSSYNLKRPNP